MAAIAATTRQRVEHGAVLDVAMRVETEIETESESRSDVVVDTGSSIEEEEFVLTLEHMVDGSEDVQGEMENGLIVRFVNRLFLNE